MIGWEWFREHAGAIERTLRDLALAAVLGLATGLAVMVLLGWRE